MFVSKSPDALTVAPFHMIGQEWLLLTATAPDGRYNSMTASWGGLGVLWGKPVLYCFIRPQRYTHVFSEQGEHLSACVFDPRYRDALTLCGTRSGRELDKARACHFTPVTAKNGAVYYEEARLVFLGRKLYTGKIDPQGFCDPGIAALYPTQDYHTVYVYEIEEVLEAE